MAKPIRALEMHYPVIQFLIIIPLFHRRDIVGRFLPFNQNFRKFVSSGKWYRNFLKKFPEIPETVKCNMSEMQIIQPKVLEIVGNLGIPRKVVLFLEIFEKSVPFAT